MLNKNESPELPHPSRVLAAGGWVALFSCLTVSAFAQASKQTDPQAPPTSTPTYPLNQFRNFSAIMVGSRAEPGEGTSRGHIYRLGNLLRMEEPDGRAYFITNLDSGETYGIVENNCIHDDNPYVRAIPFYLTGLANATITRAPAGKETVDGHSCQVEDITVSSPALPNPQKMRFWQADDLQAFPIKIQFTLPGGRGPVIHYKNVVLDPPDPTLFVHPKSCQALPQNAPPHN